MNHRNQGHKFHNQKKKKWLKKRNCFLSESEREILGGDEMEEGPSLRFSSTHEQLLNASLPILQGDGLKVTRCKTQQAECGRQR